MNDTAEVYLWGTRIGIIHQDISKTYAYINSIIGEQKLRVCNI